MYYSRISVILSLLPLVLGQDYGSPASTTTTTAASSTSTSSGTSGSVQVVKVGDGALTFSPNTITAAVGESIEFVFYPSQHSVAESTFADPCTPLNTTGFFSGGFKTTSGANANSFTITVNNTKPIWFYCAYPGHCESGMSGVINAPSDGSKTLAEYQAAAANVGTTVAPKVVQGGVVGPVKSESSSGTSTGSTTSSGSTSTSSSTSSATAKSAGVESRGALQWTVMAATGLVAVAMSSLIM